MTKSDPVDIARDLVLERYPSARQAWLAGSVVLGGPTATSDLDIPVLLRDGDDEAHRESLVFRDWLVELFVHSEDSFRRMVAIDVGRRRPTMARMVSTGVPLLPGQAGSELRSFCVETLAAGPAPLTDHEIAIARSGLADVLDDLDGGAAPEERDAIAVEVWRRSAELLLACSSRWTGTGKWLVRELRALDEAQGSTYASRLHEGLHAALADQPEALREVAEAILGLVGGRTRAGFYFVSRAAV